MKARSLRSLRLLILVAASLFALPLAAKPKADVAGPRPIAVTARPLGQFLTGTDQTRFGGLEFRGGIVLGSADRYFGGISGLAVDGDRWLAVTDAGSWISWRLETDGDRPTGLADVTTGAILGPRGQIFAKVGAGDAESVSFDHGTAYVGIEGANIVARFNIAGAGLGAHARIVPAPAGIKRLPGNRGLEALAVAPAGSRLAGAVVAISERSGASDAPTRGFIIGGPRPGEFMVRRIPPFDISDAAFLPNGDLLLLERSLTLWQGFGMQVRRIPAASIRPGAMADGAVLMRSGRETRIGNMEALAVSRNARGEIILTLMSDDGFLSLQDTVLLRFALIGG